MPKINMKIVCNKSDCFQNNSCQKCKLLTEVPHGECPFYKTQMRVDRERLEAHQKLADKGRYDLIQKYEYNRYREGQW